MTGYIAQALFYYLVKNKGAINCFCNSQPILNDRGMWSNVLCWNIKKLDVFYIFIRPLIHIPQCQNLILKGLLKLSNFTRFFRFPPTNKTTAKTLKFKLRIYLLNSLFFFFLFVSYFFLPLAPYIFFLLCKMWGRKGYIDPLAPQCCQTSCYTSLFDYNALEVFHKKLLSAGPILNYTWLQLSK